MTSYLINY